MKYGLFLIVLIFVSPLAAQETTLGQLERRKPQPITRICLTHKTNDPSKIVVNWMSDESGDSVVRFGLTKNYNQTVRIDDNTTLHHVEIPLTEKDAIYHYSVSTGGQHSAVATFKAYPTDILRVVVAADWQRRPDLSAILKDDHQSLATSATNWERLNLRGGQIGATAFDHP